MRAEAKEHSAVLQVMNEAFINATVLKTVRGLTARRKMKRCPSEYVAGTRCKFSVKSLLIHMLTTVICCSIEMHAARLCGSSLVALPFGIRA
jgi:hypothetical protein